LSTTYTGVPGNISALTPVTATIPADGDALSAASVNTPLQKLADYVAFLEQQAGLTAFHFVGNPGNTASTTYYAWAGLSQGAVATAPTASAKGQTQLYVPFAGVIRKFMLRTAQTTVGGTVIVTLNNVSTGQTLGLYTLAAGTIASFLTAFTAGGISAVSAGDVIDISIANQSGVSTSIGLTGIVVAFSAA
jgi:hypothetical protein